MLGKKVIAKTIGYLLYVAVICINKTLKISIENKSGHELFATEPYIFAIWHKNTFTPFYCYRNKDIAMFVSSNLKGMILEQTAKLLGYDTIPYGKDDTRHTINIKKKLEQKQNAIMAVDGPTGPALRIKEGCHYLTDKTHVPTVAIHVNYSAYFPIFWRWDKYCIPFPFSKVIITFSKPFSLNNEWVELQQFLEA